MKRLPFIFMLIILVSVSIGADSVFDRIDDLHDQEKYQECIEIINGELDGASDEDKAELLWRSARATLEIGDEIELAGASEAEILAKFEEGEQYATEAIAADPERPSEPAPE